MILSNYSLVWDLPVSIECNLQFIFITNDVIRCSLHGQSMQIHFFNSLLILSKRPVWFEFWKRVSRLATSDTKINFMRYRCYDFMSTNYTPVWTCKAQVTNNITSHQHSDFIYNMPKIKFTSSTNIYWVTSIALLYTLKAKSISWSYRTFLLF